MVVLLHIQNRWVISILFIVISLLVVLGLTIYKNEKTVDLSDVEINHLKLNETFDNSEYSLNKHVKLDRYVFYNHNKYKNLNGDKFLTNIWFYLIFLLFFGLLLFLITLIVQKPAVIFTLGIFLVFIVPFLQPFLGLIPEWGDNIQKSLKYIPFSYLTEKSSSGSIKFTNWQWFISIASIVILFIADVLYAAKRDI